jgi:dihydropteroate synthase
VASRAVDAGAEIINDVSGLRWDPGIAGIAAANNTGLVLMHSLGEFETMHTQEPVADIVGHVIADFNRATAQAVTAGVNARQIVLDIGIGFGKTFEQNLEVLANIDKINAEFPLFPILAGASRKSFIGKVLDEPDPQRRLNGSVAAAVVAVTNGAKIVRVHDVKETVDAVRIADAIRDRRKQA